MTFDYYIDLINDLKDNTKPLWGNMTAQHMVEHLILVVQTSNGKIILSECMNPPKKYPLLKRILQSSRPLPRNFVNTVVGAGLKPLVYKNLQSAKEDLIVEIQNFNLFFKKNPEAKPLNVTFGPLSHKEWILFHNKHFTHHLTQFGLIVEENEGKKYF